MRWYGLALFMGLSILHAEEVGSSSSPTACSFGVGSSLFEALKDPYFQRLKQGVLLASQEGWCSPRTIELIMNLVYQTQPRACVEIGAFVGSSMLPIAATLRYLGQGSLYAIDAWSNEEITKYLIADEANYSHWSRTDMTQCKQKCQQVVSRWDLGSHCTLIHATSEKVASQFSEIDFLHLDGNFSEEGSLLDVELFLPKVKPGGYILVSNVFAQVNGHLSKMASIWRLLDACDVIWHEEPSVALFRKN